MGDQAESLVRCSDGPGRARRRPAEAADCVPEWARERVAVQQRYEDRAAAHPVRGGSDTDSRHRQLPETHGGLPASEAGIGGPIRDGPEFDRAKWDERQP